MRVALLDVNILVALMDRVHLSHAEAHRWFDSESHAGWATCAITVNGCLRILGRAAYNPNPLQIADLAARLNDACLASRSHQYDRKIPLAAVRGATRDHLTVLKPA
jgi:hypothetical protein